MSEEKTIVMDMGSLNTRIGFAGEFSPKYIIPSPEGLVGENGIIKDWKKFESLLSDCEKRVGKLEDRSILLIQPPHLPNELILKEAKLLFEVFKVGSVFIAISSVLALYSSGRLDGLVVESGNSYSAIVPIKKGYAIKQGCVTFPISGSSISDSFISLFSQLKNDKDARFIKEKSKSDMTTTHTLSESQIVNVTPEQFSKATDSMYSKNGGIHVAILETAEKSGMDVKELLGNLLFTGGNTKLDHFFESVVGPLQLLYKEKFQSDMPQIVPFIAADATLLPWIGGSILSALPTFAPLQVSRLNYITEGDSAIIKKLTLKCE